MKKIKVIVQTTLCKGLHQVGACGDREEEKIYVRCGEGRRGWTSQLDNCKDLAGWGEEAS